MLELNCTDVDEDVVEEDEEDTESIAALIASSTPEIASLFFRRRTFFSCKSVGASDSPGLVPVFNEGTRKDIIDHQFNKKKLLKYLCC